MSTEKREVGSIRLWQVRERAIGEQLLEGTLTINAVEIMSRELQEEYGSDMISPELREFIERRKRDAPWRLRKTLACEAKTHQKEGGGKGKPCYRAQALRKRLFDRGDREGPPSSKSNIRVADDPLRGHHDLCLAQESRIQRSVLAMV
jgi:hypothetical protein